jgi:endonuclease YncB( thermonuclease family)
MRTRSAAYAAGVACLLTVIAAGLLAAAGSASTDGRFSYTGMVARVVDGDTLDVVLAGGKRERVRLIGIDAPERGACYAVSATARARQLALSKRVVLKGDATQDTRDRYGRLLAYVWIPGGKDLGYQLVAGGFARVYVYRNAYERLPAYRKAEAAAKGGTVGQWKSCGSPLPPPTTAASTCHPSYSPCLPVVGDLDCADVRALGVAPVRVLGSDPYRLDGDNDGYGCE